MAITPGGPIVVTTPGTLVRAIVNVAPLKSYACHGVMFQALPGNTGKVYIGNVAMDKTALTGLFAILAIPTDNTLPSFSTALTFSPNGLGLDQFYVDADSPDDGCLLVYLVT